MSGRKASNNFFKWLIIQIESNDVSDIICSILCQLDISKMLYGWLRKGEITFPAWLLPLPGQAILWKDWTNYFRLPMDIYKFLYFRHCIWRQLFIQSSLALCFVMFKYFCENFLVVFSLQNRKNVQTTLRQCKRD